MKGRTHHKKMIALVIILLLAVFVMAGFFTSKFCLTVTTYQIQSDKIDSSVRIVQLTDLHDSEFGADNKRLVSKIRAQSPDVILITGDLLNAGEQDTDVAVRLIADLSEICQVYISYGNHEYEYEEAYQIDLKSLYEAAGAVVLEYEYEDLTINGQRIRLGGIYGYCIPAKYLETNEADPEECAFLEEFQDTDLYTVLMCHMPVCWILNDGLDEWSVDCVLAGHVHGGQVILPFVGGLYAPDFGWFPGKLEGLYDSSDGDKVLVLSRGLGSTETIPRFNNIPEIVVVDLLPQ